jgi:cyclase
MFVKTTKFSKPVYIGDPVNTINLFNKFEVDEIVVLDISCSRKRKKPNFELIEELASECWVPLSYGGGIRSVDDAKRILNSGVEKVIFESLLHLNANEIKKCVDQFGSSSVVVCLDVKKTFFGKYLLRTLNNSKSSQFSLDKALEMIIDIGVGEVIVNNISRDGTRLGYNCELLQYVSKHINCPVIALGGASCLEDFKTAIDNGANAAAAGSFFVFQNNNTDSVLIHFPERHEIETLFNGKKNDL